MADYIPMVKTLTPTSSDRPRSRSRSYFDKRANPDILSHHFSNALVRRPIKVNAKACKCATNELSWKCCIPDYEKLEYIGSGGGGVVLGGVSRHKPTAYKMVDFDSIFPNSVNELEFEREVEYSRHFGNIDIGPQVVEAYISVENPQSRKGVLVMRRYQMSLAQYLSQVLIFDHRIGVLVFDVMLKLAMSGHVCIDLKPDNFVVNLDNNGDITAARMIDFNPDWCTSVRDEDIDPLVLAFAMTAAFRFITFAMNHVDVLPNLETGWYYGVDPTAGAIAYKESVMLLESTEFTQLMEYYSPGGRRPVDRYIESVRHGHALL